jgi:hypothetical protein
MRSFELRRSLAAALVGLAAVAGPIACGGGGSAASSKDYQAEANQVCRDAQSQFDRIVRTNPKTADQAEKQAAALVDVSQQALDNLHQIEPPSNLKQVYGRYLDARQKAIDYIGNARDAAARNDGAAYARAKRQVAATQPLRRQLAQQAGLRSCSVPTVSLGK